MLYVRNSPPRPILFLSQCCTHAFFDEIRDPNAFQPDGTPIPDYYFQFSPEETASAPQVVPSLIPPHKAAVARNANRLYGRDSSRGGGGGYPEEGRGELKGTILSLIHI